MAAQDWPEARMTRFLQLLSGPLSAQGIADVMSREFHIKVTRCSVLGKLHRMRQLTPELIPASRPHVREPDRPPKKKRKPTGAASVAVRRSPSLSGPDRFECYPSTEAACRWPIGDPGQPSFFFCGKASLKGFPYCSQHCSAAYLPRRLG